MPNVSDRVKPDSADLTVGYGGIADGGERWRTRRWRKGWDSNPREA
jgi:hypothetical protein